MLSSKSSLTFLLLLLFLFEVKGTILAQDPLYQESHALLIDLEGSNEGNQLRDGNPTQTERLGQVLTANGWETTTLSEPNLAQIETSLRSFIASQGNEEKNRLLIYLTGKTQTGGRGGDSFLTADGGKLSLKSVKEMLRKVKSNHLFLIINGRTSVSPARRSAGESDRQMTEQDRPAWISIISGSGTPSPNFRFIFSYYLLRAIEQQEADLDKDGWLTASELCRYLVEKIGARRGSRWSPSIDSLDQLQGRDRRNAGDIDITGGTRGSPGSVAIPEFTWPPPSPSDRWMLPRRWFYGRQTLGQTAELIEAALAFVGYRYSYYRVPGGYAIACALERIRPDGTPLEGPYRWRREMPPLRALSLGEMLRALVGALPGHYRVIVFLVTDQPISGQGQVATSDQSDKWVAEGTDRLPDPIQKTQFNANHRVTTLVYEFQQNSGGSAPIPVTRSLVSAKDHLQRARLYDPLSEF